MTVRLTNAKKQFRPFPIHLEKAAVGFMTISCIYVFGGLLHDFVFLLLGSCPFDYEASSTMLVKNGGA